MRAEAAVPARASWASAAAEDKEEAVGIVADAVLLLLFLCWIGGDDLAMALLLAIAANFIRACGLLVNEPHAAAI